MNRQLEKIRRRKKRISTRKMYRRLLVVFGAIVVFMLLYLWRIVDLNREKGDEYEKRVLSQQSYVSNTIAYRRGDIVDRNGNKLATSKKMYNLIIDPGLMLSDAKYFEPTTDALEKTVGMKAKSVRKVLDKYPNSHYYVVKKYKGLDVETVDAFHALEREDKYIKGVWFEEEYVRQYPYSTVASNVIGFCSTDNVGIWGIENQYNDKLSGSSGKKYGYYDSDLNLIETVKEPENGKKIISTIDVNVQGLLEQHMQIFQKNTGSQNMGCIIMNPQNGEIYAMASTPGYDLNNPSNLDGMYSKEQQAAMDEKQKMEILNSVWRNYCISDSYEPGSTFKPITAAVCLDEGATTPERGYVCDGYQQVGGHQIKCVAYANGGHGTVNVCKALMESCNDALMQMGADLGGKKFLRYVNEFGFGQKTGIDLPGEATGNIFNESTLRTTELATSSFGQSQTVTMIQLASAFCATINGGNYYKPHVVKEIQSESGATVEDIENTLVRKVITEDTSKLIRQYLYKTVQEGSAAPAQISGYKIGGKTGTAEKYPRRMGNYLVSFIGFTPVDNPEVVVYVTIDQPHVQDQAHSTYATEFANSVMKDVLPLLGIYKKASAGDDEQTKIQLPSTKNGNLPLEVPQGGYSDGDYQSLGGNEAANAEAPTVTEAPEEEPQETEAADAEGTESSQEPQATQTPQAGGETASPTDNSEPEL
ncbi:MAG: peptidoglycan glycosyltransferase [Lachnospiraceae bacterium]|nr:peptidoglycan glycosyltransferase [Lachnospiraceae bacterium]